MDTKSLISAIPSSLPTRIAAEASSQTCSKSVDGVKTLHSPATTKTFFAEPALTASAAAFNAVVPAFVVPAKSIVTTSLLRSNA